MKIAEYTGEFRRLGIRSGKLMGIEGGFRVGFIVTVTFTDELVGVRGRYFF